MPTIKDIAREAGVSHGTVSNVINGRGNVSVEKIRLVWQAAEKLGYKVNAKAQSLRLGKDRAIAVMLPGIEYTHWAAMYDVFQSRVFTERIFCTALFHPFYGEQRTVPADGSIERPFQRDHYQYLPDGCIVPLPAEAPDLPLVFCSGKVRNSRM